jgi:hypothetical protein
MVDAHDGDAHVMAGSLARATGLRHSLANPAESHQTYRGLDPARVVVAEPPFLVDVARLAVHVLALETYWEDRAAAAYGPYAV